MTKVGRAKGTAASRRSHRREPRHRRPGEEAAPRRADHSALPLPGVVAPKPSAWRRPSSKARHGPSSTGPAAEEAPARARRAGREAHVAPGARHLREGGAAIEPDPGAELDAQGADHRGHLAPDREGDRRGASPRPPGPRHEAEGGAPGTTRAGVRPRARGGKARDRRRRGRLGQRRGRRRGQGREEAEERRTVTARGSGKARAAARMAPAAEAATRRARAGKTWAGKAMAGRAARARRGTSRRD